MATFKKLSMHNYIEKNRKQYSVENIIEAWGLRNNFYLASVLQHIHKASSKNIDSTEYLRDIANAHWYLEEAIGYAEEATHHLNYPDPEDYAKAQEEHEKHKADGTDDELDFQ